MHDLLALNCNPRFLIGPIGLSDLNIFFLVHASTSSVENLGCVLGANIILLSGRYREKDFEEKHQNQIHSQNDYIVFHRIVFIRLNVGKRIGNFTMKCIFYR